jgi:glyceraldehyde 3-phosphate dehydrogenase
LLKHDSNYGTYHEEVGHDDQNLLIGEHKIRVTAEKDPALLPWQELGIDVVIESTGRFTKAEDAKKHLQAGAKRVVISGPAKGEGVGTFVVGVNEHDLTPTTPWYRTPPAPPTASPRSRLSSRNILASKKP